MKNSPIILYTHNRHLYLELTINSILYSITDDPEVVVHIFMVCPTREVEELCLKKLKENNQIRLYKIFKNVAFGAGNLALQILRPKTFVLWEDDFIIPQHTRHLLPKWNSIFTEKLKTHQLVSFTSSVENNVYEYLDLIPDTNNDFLFSNPKTVKWFLNPPKTSITGNGLATSLKTYLEGLRWLQNTQWKTGYHFASDHAISHVSPNRLYLSVRGYHIGANQEMDGFPNISNRIARFPQFVDDDQQVFIYETGNTISLKLSDLTDIDTHEI